MEARRQLTRWLEDEVIGSTLRRTLVVIVAVLSLAACSPPSTSAVVDLRLASDGSVERTRATFMQGWSDPFAFGYLMSDANPADGAESTDQPAPVQLDQVREACLDDGTCIRLEPGATIVESSDGFETERTVWSVRSGESWLDPTHGADGVRAVAEVYDILVMPDQTVRVAAGDLGVLVRSVDGKWSPSEADLRTLSKGLLIALALAGLLVTLMGAMLGARLPGPHVESATTMGALLLFPAVLLVSWLFFAGSAGFGFLFLVLPGFATVPVAGVLIVFALDRERRFSGGRFFVVFLRELVLACAFFLGSAGVLYVLWSRAVVGWPVFLVGVHLLAPVAAYRVARQVEELRGNRMDAQIREIELRNPIPIALAAVGLLTVGLPLLVWATGA